MTDDRSRVLVLSRSYPNDVTPVLGLWVEWPTLTVARHAEVEVIAPVPYCPPLPPLGEMAERARLRAVPDRERRHGLEVRHPRFVTGPGYTTHRWDSRTYGLTVRRAVRRVRDAFPFDLIHAHFVYPDGVVAAGLGREYGVPVVVTDHAPWDPWMHEFPHVRRLAVEATRQFGAHIAVSRSMAEGIASFTGAPERITVIPNGVDEHLFRPGDPGDRDPDKILFVGVVRAAKGLDVLLDAFERLMATRPSAHLVVVGGGMNVDQQRQTDELRARAAASPAHDRITFTGVLEPAAVARHMATSAVLVMPSRLESFGAALIEALACGTPVVATRSGGPEDIVVDEVGRLVPVDDPEALAGAVGDVLAHSERFPADRLRDYALGQFGLEQIGARILEVYRSVLAGDGGPDGG